MKKLQYILTIFIFLFISHVVALDNDELLKIGKKLYLLEHSAWNGTDIVRDKYPWVLEKTYGCVSYQYEKEVINIFYDKEENILIKLNFGENASQKPKSIDTVLKEANEIEKKSIFLKKDAFSRLYADTSGFISHYENTAFNFIPFINDGQVSVYVLTGPQYSGEILIGNDYHYHYTDELEFEEVEKIHNSLISLPYKGDTVKIKQTIHSHVLSDRINETDVCTLLLYRDYVEWDVHMIYSKKLVSFFNLRKESLTSIPAEKYFDIKNKD
jgi:hypothetical protein